MCEPNTQDLPLVYLGGGHVDAKKKCVKLECNSTSDVAAMHCSHEEADDRLMVHINHAVDFENIHRIIVVSPDTDVIVCLLYHFEETFHLNGLLELWVLCGQGKTCRALPIHTLSKYIPHNVIHVLPAVHALTGCDSTSKISTKKKDSSKQRRLDINSCVTLGN